MKGFKDDLLWAETEFKGNSRAKTKQSIPANLKGLLKYLLLSKLGNPFNCLKL